MVLLLLQKKRSRGRQPRHHVHVAQVLQCPPKVCRGCSPDAACSNGSGSNPTHNPTHHLEHTVALLQSSACKHTHPSRLTTELLSLTVPCVSTVAHPTQPGPPRLQQRGTTRPRLHAAQWPTGSSSRARAGHPRHSHACARTAQDAMATNALSATRSVSPLPTFFRSHHHSAPLHGSVSTRAPAHPLADLTCVDVGDRKTRKKQQCRDFHRSTA